MLNHRADRNARPLWQFIPPYVQTVQTDLGPLGVLDQSVPRVAARFETPEQELQALETAILQADIDNIAARVLGELLPKYSVEIRLALLHRHWELIHPALLEGAAHPTTLLGEFAERRLRANSFAAARTAASGRQLARAHCEIAFDDGATTDLARLAASLCREFCASVGHVPAAYALHVALARLKEALGEEARWLPLVSRDDGEVYCKVFEGLADVAREAQAGSAACANGSSLAPIYGACASLARCSGIQPPLPGRSGVTVGGAVSRLRDPSWWVRQLRKVYGREAESAVRALGMVSRHAGLYVSEPTFERFARQRVRTRGFLAAMQLINEHGEVLSLEAAFAASVSNPKLRRLELMTRMAGCERFAQDAGDDVLVCTLTLPSRFHCVHSGTGKQNPTFDGSDVQAGQRQLQSSWAKVRAALQRASVTIYGFRCSEPNHDGTIHWHMMICVRPDDAAIVRQTITRYFLDELDANEPGASAHRVNFIDIDPTRGSAVSYLAKYISKNIDGEGVGPDAQDDDRQRDAKETAQRAVAHARTHGLRQFQPFGLPAVTIWRELRRLRAAPGGALDELWRAASEDGDFQAFIRLMGGPGRRSAERPVTLHHERSRRVGRYGEHSANRLRGLRIGNVIVATRDFDWRLMRSCLPAPTWTRGNNCTRGSEWMRVDSECAERIEVPCEPQGVGIRLCGPPLQLLLLPRIVVTQGFGAFPSM